MQVQNRRMLDRIYDMTYGDTLEHHGVEGMQWGVQNGPPYPLSGDNKSAAEEQYKANKKLAREEKKREKEAAKTAKRDKQRQRMIEKADVEGMRKHRDWFTTQEIAAAMQKQQLLSSAESSKTSRKKRKILEEADLDKIRKNPEMFTSDEMNYALRRRELLDQQRNKSKSQVDKEHDLEDRLAKIQKAAQVATAATSIIALGTAGLNFVNAYKTTKAKDADAADKQWKTQFDALKAVNKTMALKSFNDYWKTDYSLSKSESDAEKAYTTLWAGLGEYYDKTTGKITDQKAFDDTLKSLKSMSEIMSKGGKDKDKD